MVRLVVSFTALVAWAGAALAGTISAQINSDSGAVVANAVVYAVPTAGQVPAPSKAAVMAQENQAFDPFVLPVQVGSSVEFPNRDSFRHHVYSFSPAKPFELKLFGGTERQVVTFDKEGAVALGCNIHDNMLGYIFAVPTPYFAKTGEDGKAVLSLPAGAYTVKVWHPNQKASGTDNATAMNIAAEGVAEYKAAVMMKSDRKAKKPGAKDETEY
jgi:plastocyanin